MSSKLEEDQRAGYCRHCGERLPLIKRVKREEFCSDDHRERYLSSTQSVALSRLREAGGATYESDAEAVAVAEEVAYAPPPPPDPPMAGTIGPEARTVPWRLAAVFDGEDERLGQWEPARPQPQWHHLVLEFGLAEFSIAPASLAGEPLGGIAAAFDTLPTETSATLALPRNGIALDLEMERGEIRALLEELENPGSGDPPWAGMAPAAPVRQCASLHRRIAPVSEAVEIDSTLYLPAFSPSAALASLEAEGWVAAGWLWEMFEFAPRGTAGLMPAPSGAEAMEPAAMLELPVASGCVIEPAAEPELEPQPATKSLDELLDQIGAIAAPASKNLEERGMSEVQSIAERTGPQGLGERIANPFLPEPQPRPGSGTPRWVPVTVSLGTSVEASTEDWDIL